MAEAFAAARDLTDDFELQIEFAAGLMGIPADEARQHAGSRVGRRSVSVEYRGSARPVRRTVVVERRRRPALG